jgi:hypothetical protein
METQGIVEEFFETRPEIVRQIEEFEKRRGLKILSSLNSIFFTLMEKLLINPITLLFIFCPNYPSTLHSVGVLFHCRACNHLFRAG